MNALNAILTRVSHALLTPFAALPLVGLLFWSAVAGVVMTLVFGRTSNQRALAAAADRTRAQLLAIRLFKDDLGVALRAQVELLKATGWRLLHSLPPMLVMAVPFVLVLAQLSLWYEHRPLVPGERTIIAVQLAPQAWTQSRDVELEAPPSVAVETAALRDGTDRTLYWRLRALKPGPVTLRWQFGPRVVEKQLALAENPRRLQRVSVRRPGAGILDRLLNPGEPGFGADSPVQAIVVRHPSRRTPVLGLDLPWWATFVLASIVAALVVRPLLRVRF
ncbi:MAG: hypothetical protein ACOC46_01085 [Pirellulales bacterium]